jgi:hypothetical protein
MKEPVDSPLLIDASALTSPVRAALDDDGATVCDWRHEPYGHSLDDVYGTTRSIFRVCGTARTISGDAAWTMVLKIVAAPGTPADPPSPANGDREPLAYRSGLLEGLSGVRAPRCYGVIDRPGGGYWLWLEDVVDAIGRQWPRERYLLAARHLGEFNATNARIVARADAYPWLSRSPLAGAAREMTPGVARIRDARGNPYVAEAISPEAADALLSLVGNLDGWLARLDGMPQTICHWDAHRANLISSRSPQGMTETVAIDWAGIGFGPFGAETSKLLSQTVNFYGMREDALPALDAELFEHYVDGLRSAGWRGDTQVVRFGHTAASAVRLVVRTATALELAFNPQARAGFERASKLPFATLAAKFRATLPYYLSLAAEAGRLAGEL